MRKALLLAVGFMAGFGSAALGIGGGVILVPALSLIFHFQTRAAIGTSLRTAVFISLVGVISHFFINPRNVNLIIALLLILGTVIGTRFGAELANKLSNRRLSKLFAILLFIISFKMMGFLKIPAHFLSIPPVRLLLPFIGIFTGFASALLGIGGGIIIVPVLTLFFGLTMQQAVATSLLVILPTTFMGSLYHSRFRNVIKEAVPFLVFAAVFGAVSGALVCNSLSSEGLKALFGIIVLLVAARIFFRKPARGGA